MKKSFSYYEHKKYLHRGIVPALDFIDLEKAKEIQENLIAQAVLLMDSLVVKNDFLKDLLLSLVQRKK